ncbi:hypothetical protein EV421DRAFT_1744084 [Armillaria borealis]|uniref:Uncharacterized protein n=1 Tax=Armillaria borealis TaxID=47425 RepID=A0AA39ITU8_9AGAR|nr:hypothetical protein EV421DRAFT_1744084 [Armillaria borealis]
MTAPFLLLALSTRFVSIHPFTTAFVHKCIEGTLQDREGQGIYLVIDNSSQADLPLITEHTHRWSNDWGAAVEGTTMVLGLDKVTNDPSLTPTHKIRFRSRPNLCEAFESGDEADVSHCRRRVLLRVSPATSSLTVSTAAATRIPVHLRLSLDGINASASEKRELCDKAVPMTDSNYHRCHRPIPSIGGERRSPLYRFHLSTISRGTRLGCHPGPRSDAMPSISYGERWMYACDIVAMVAEEEGEVWSHQRMFARTGTDVGPIIEGGSNRPEQRLVIDAPTLHSILAAVHRLYYMETFSTLHIRVEFFWAQPYTPGGEPWRRLWRNPTPLEANPGGNFGTTLCTWRRTLDLETTLANPTH